MFVLIAILIIYVIFLLVNFIKNKEDFECSKFHRFFEPSSNIVYKKITKLHFINSKKYYFINLNIDFKKYIKNLICILFEVLFLAIVLTTITFQPRKTINPTFNRKDYDDNKTLYYEYKGKINSYTVDIEKKKKDIKIYEIRDEIYQELIGTNLKQELITDRVNFITTLKDYDISISWDYDEKLFNFDGTINFIDDNIINTKVVANISYKDKLYTENYFLKLKKRDIVDIDYIEKNSIKDDKNLILPTHNGEIIWYESLEDSIFKKIILVIGITLIVGYFSIKKIINLYDKRRSELIRAYPYFVTTIAIYMEVESNFINVWKRLEADLQMYKILCELISKSIISIQNGMNTQQALENFADACDIEQYREFVRIINQGLKLGTQDLVKSLKTYAFNAQQKRIDDIKIKAQSLQTKMILPLMLMLLVVFIIIMAPTFIAIG